MSNTIPLTFVTWKWRGPDPARQFPSHAVNALYAMIVRHYHAPFRLVCLTDDFSGLDGKIDAVPLPVTKADALLAPNTTFAKTFPSCFRRLWLFSEEAKALGARICLLDIDVIILEDITDLVDGKTADFVGWCGKDGLSKIAGGMWLLTTGSHTDVWDAFDPQSSPALAYTAGHRGSDQGWLSYMLYPPQERWTMADGIYKMTWLRKSGQRPPPEVKMVFTTGLDAPWTPRCQLGHSWVRDYWRLD